MPARLTERVATPLAFVLAAPTAVPFSVNVMVFPLTGVPLAVRMAERVVVPPYVPPAGAGDRLVSETALWTMVTVCPATVIVRVRGPENCDFDATEYVNEPFPVPVAPEVIVIEAALLVAVQLQLPDVATVTVPVPPL